MPASRADRIFLKLSVVTLISLYLVILAGSVVRATGSGMGCPDWPKCFGYYIPPTDPSQVEFHAGHVYEKGMMIIVHDTLWRATSDFTSGNSFERSQWEKYPVHDYAKFYVQQSWTEYINRLLGALSAFLTSVLFAVSLFRFKKDKLSIVLLFFGIIVLGFVGWMGKVVVDSDLKPVMITFHMLSALVMVSIVIFTQARVRMSAGMLEGFATGKNLKIILLFALALTFIQVILGSQVRQQIDVINNNMSGMSRGTWISQLNGMYVVHIISAIIVLLLNATVFYFLLKAKPVGGTRLLVFALLLTVLCEYGVGVFMHNFSIPAYAQPVHLLFALILFGIQFGLVVRTKAEKKLQ